MRRFLTHSILAILLGFIVTPSAFAQQSINLQIGGFVLAGSQTAGGTVINDRNSGDVLAANLVPFSAGGPDFVFNLNDFNGPTVNFEYLVGVGDNIEAGLGVG